MSNLFQALAQRAVRPDAITPRPRSLFEDPSPPTANPEMELENDPSSGEAARARPEAPTLPATAAISPQPARSERIEVRADNSRPDPEVHREEKTLRETHRETREILSRFERIIEEKPTSSPASVSPRGEIVVPLIPARNDGPVPSLEQNPEPRRSRGPESQAEAPQIPAIPPAARVPLLVPHLAPFVIAPGVSLEERSRGNMVGPPPAIRVTIGRVEVRADLPASAAPTAAASPRKNSPVISLEEYLRESTPQRRRS